MAQGRVTPFGPAGPQAVQWAILVLEPGTKLQGKGSCRGRELGPTPSATERSCFQWVFREKPAS